MLTKVENMLRPSCGVFVVSDALFSCCSIFWNVIQQRIINFAVKTICDVEWLTAFIVASSRRASVRCVSVEEPRCHL